MEDVLKQFDIKDAVVVITGGAGVLGCEMVKALVQLGARVAILDQDEENAKQFVVDETFPEDQVAVFFVDVLDREILLGVRDKVVATFGKPDILINAAGGNHPQATTSIDSRFFDLPVDAIEKVFSLNVLGTILPSQIFGELMAEQQTGVILNISSMNAFRPLTRIPAYSAAKAGVSNFTQWLAVHMAQEYSPNIRVNALAPGFFLTQQNQFLLMEQDGESLTERGQQIIAHTPMDRFGAPQDLIGTLVWLLSPASQFVTGIVVPVDGGFSAYSGV